MEILWNKNPLRTQIVLDDHDKEVLWLKIKIEELKERIFDAGFRLNKDDKYFDLELARQILDSTYYESEDDVAKPKIDKRVDDNFDIIIEELSSTHAGDCTCVPCSCSKCWAENILGIDTIKNSGKHSLYKIDSAFGKDSSNSFSQALEKLFNYDPGEPGPMWKGKHEMYYECVPRWKQEAVRAYEWLKQYGDNHPEVIDT